jgi:signal transduction histidine kinase/CheY-like chemotaxis protein
MSVTDYFVSRYRLLFNREQDILDRTRVRILSTCLLTYIGFTTALITLFLFQGPDFRLIRMGIFLTCYLTGLAMLLSRRSWSLVAHFFIICLTLMIWSGILLFRMSVNVATAETVLLVVCCGYYILGSKWGTIYSLLNITPIIGYVILDEYVGFSLPTQQLNISHHSFLLGLVTNFLLLLYVHYAFFRAFQKSQRNEQEQAAAKTNFLSTMSHELRTPLNAVVGMAHLLQMEGPRPDQEEHLKVLRFASDNLMATVNDILDFNKIESGAVVLDKQAFRPAELLDNVCGSFRARAAEKGIGFSCDIDIKLQGLTVSGDTNRLSSILFNLVGNAVKFTTAGHVRVEARLIGQTEATASLRLQVQDTGIGIPQDRQAQVFQPFIQANSRTNRQFHGTGLGLTIAHRLLQLHGSGLQLHSTEGIGTTFSFELNYPLATQAPPLPALTDTVAGSVAGLRVLVAEDEPINVLVITKILAKWGIVPQVAANGREAVDMVMQHDFDVVLMDINMPVMDGLEAAKTIKALPDPKKAAVAIIAVTASIGRAIEQIKVYPFIDDCLLKPFKPSELLEKLQRLENIGDHRQ